MRDQLLHVPVLVFVHVPVHVLVLVPVHVPVNVHVLVLVPVHVPVNVLVLVLVLAGLILTNSTVLPHSARELGGPVVDDRALSWEFDSHGVRVRLDLDV